MAVWVLLNSSSDIGTSNKDPLEAAVQEFRPIVTQAIHTLRKEQNRKKKYVAAYMDASKWGQWIQKELYAWTFPTLIVQRHVGIGERYFFKGGGQLPEKTEELVDFVKKADKYKLDARRKSQRPQLLAANEDWKQLVGDNIESELRSSPATLVYAFKVDTGIDDSAEDVAEEEKEQFKDFASWVKTVCQPSPPAVAIFDARENEVPMTLYASSDFALQSMPAVYLVQNDHGKLKYGRYWGAPISRYDPPKVTEAEDKSDDNLDDKLHDKTKILESFNMTLAAPPPNLFATHMQGIMKWAVAEVRKIPEISAPNEAEVDALVHNFTVQAPPVAELDDQTLPDFLARNPLSLVEFYAPWCGHCKKLEPTYAAAARMAKKRQGQVAEVKFAKIDADKNQRAGQKYKVEGYPTMYFFRYGVKQHYNAPIKRRHHIVGWLDRELKPEIEEISTVSNITAKYRPAAVFHGAGPVIAIIHGVAKETKHYVDWYVVTGASKETPLSLDLLLPGESKPIAFEGRPDSTEITNWIRLSLAKSEPVPESQSGPVHKVVTKTFDKDVLEAKSHVLLEVYAPWCGHCQDLEPIYAEFAQKMNDTNRDTLVAKLDGSANELLYEGWEITGYPTIFHHKPVAAKPKKVSARTVQKLEEYVNMPAEGQPQTVTDLLSQFKSEPIPEDSPMVMTRSRLS